MHPIFREPRRLIGYLAGWLVLAILLAAVLAQLGMGLFEALALVVPVLLLYAFVCLSALYVCRATPLREGAILRVLASSTLAAFVSGAVLLAFARAWIAMLSFVPSFAASVSRYDEQFPFLFAVGVLLFLLAIAVHHAVIAIEAVRQAERERLQLEVLTKEAELRALRAQIDPHFLYNSLNSISALTTADPVGARRMCTLLGDFLRSTVSVSDHDRIRLADELALADRFLDIEQVRFGSRLRVERRIDETAFECRVPPLILQPLVENAVTHGIADLLEGGVIRVDVVRDEGRLSIAIENPCDQDAPSAKGVGVGLENVRRRLAAMFGASARLDTRSEPERFRVEIELPWSTSE
jgi:two-component system sensor histidine kinase AlgZ